MSNEGNNANWSPDSFADDLKQKGQFLDEHYYRNPDGSIRGIVVGNTMSGSPGDAYFFASEDDCKNIQAKINARCPKGGNACN